MQLKYLINEFYYLTDHVDSNHWYESSCLHACHTPYNIQGDNFIEFYFEGRRGEGRGGDIKPMRACPQPGKMLHFIVGHVDVRFCIKVSFY